jgi:hypothetical protein
MRSRTTFRRALPLLGLLLLAAVFALPHVASAQGMTVVDLSGHVIYGSSEGGSVGGL